MEKTTTNRLFLVLVATLFITPVLAGCFGDGEDVDAAKDGKKNSGSDVEVVDDATDGEGLRNGTDENLKDLPKAHFHHYWGDREEVIIYKGDVEFDNGNLKWYDYNSFVGAEFDLEDDGDQVSSADDNRDLDNPHANDPAPGGHADTVFAGTSHIRINFPPNFFAGVGNLVFYYKSADTPEYAPEGGIPVAPDGTIEIKLNGVGMADPAHQTAVSRWKFRLVGQNQDNPVCENFRDYCPPAAAIDPQNPQGNPTLKGLEMIAYKGSEDLLDPPHPDFWGPKTTIAYPPVEDTVSEATAQTPLIRERHSQLTGIALPPGHLVPMGTERVEVAVDWENNQPMPEGFFMKLRYHAANGTVYMDADEVNGDCTTGSCTYTIYNVHPSEGDRGLVDPPYEANSYWRFQLVPTIIDATGEERMNAGVFEGTYTISATAFKEEGFVLV